ncbi:hypothetical protein CYY_007158 [Polysphondylium violaceum]|uniref:non-specific serine/threonine protein kinase n=1 Tax=Polysphondylium violaceum TaxID=133409 RepID=A0A8J4UY73_9MYCE|nr:hypothetical protein CYY_007158 [Polysphondylium violaceum]
MMDVSNNANNTPPSPSPSSSCNNSQQSQTQSQPSQNANIDGILIPFDNRFEQIPISLGVGQYVMFGRLPSCHYCFTELIVSGTHCRIVKKTEDTLLVEDFSTNGTFINGKLIGKGKYQLLKSGDRLGLGRPSKDLDLSFVFKGSNQPTFYWEQTGIKKEIMKEYDFIRELGTGNFSVVYEGINKINGKRVAIKYINLKKFQSEPVKFHLQLNREIEILKMVSHENIISIQDIFYIDSEQQLFFILDLADGGELYDKIGYDRPLLNELEAKYVFKQILEAVLYLHNRGIAHRDLKPENILFIDDKNDPLKIKITDFGLARFINEGELARTLCGSPLYVAPEVIVSRTSCTTIPVNGYGKTCDAWSLGAILYIILSGTPPFDDDTDEEMLSTPKLFQQIVSGSYRFPERNWASISKLALDLVVKLLTVDPNQRYTIAQALNHPWITSSFPSS